MDLSGNLTKPQGDLLRHLDELRFGIHTRLRRWEPTIRYEGNDREGPYE
jgi:hypothetical protein